MGSGRTALYWLLHAVRSQAQAPRRGRYAALPRVAPSNCHLGCTGLRTCFPARHQVQPGVLRPSSAVELFSFALKVTCPESRLHTAIGVIGDDAASQTTEQSDSASSSDGSPQTLALLSMHHGFPRNSWAARSQATGPGKGRGQSRTTDEAVDFPSIAKLGMRLAKQMPPLKSAIISMLKCHTDVGWE